jgi:uncharacterized protein YcbX
MHVTRIGLTPLKGTRHATLSHVELTRDGPVGDRVFCLVDPARARVLRTVENPSLLRTIATWAGGVLTVRLPGPRDSVVSGVPAASGRLVTVDYWGRPAALELVQGPWAAAYSRYLGREVVLARARRAGEVVYGGSVSLVTTSSIRGLAARLGRPVPDASFRATFTVDTGDDAPHPEDGWAGRRLRLGEAEVEVRGGLPRCAVVGLDPVSGERATDALRCLSGYRRSEGGIEFGVDAVVTRPGSVTTGDRVLGAATAAGPVPAAAGRG